MRERNVRCYGGCRSLQCMWTLCYLNQLQMSSRTKAMVLKFRSYNKTLAIITQEPKNMTYLKRKIVYILQ
jgi:hypothetical protein